MKIIIIARPRIITIVTLLLKMFKILGFSVVIPNLPSAILNFCSEEALC